MLGPLDLHDLRISKTPHPSDRASLSMLSCKAKGSGAPALAKHGKGALRKASIKRYQVHPVNIGVKHWCDHMHPQASELLRLPEPARIQAKKKNDGAAGAGQWQYHERKLL